MHLVGTHTGNQRQPPRDIVRVQRLDQPHKLIRLEARSAFQTDRIADAPHIFDMRAVRLARAVANPDHMRRCGIPILFIGDGIAPGHGFLIIQKERLMAGVEFGLGKRPGCFRGDPASPHEIEAFLNPARQLLELFRLRRAFQKFGDPAMDLGQVGKAALREGPQQVQRRRGLFIDAQQTLRVGNPLAGGKAHRVDHVAAIAWQLDTFDRLEGRGARLGKLSGDTPDLDDRHRCTKGQHHRHLQDDLEGVADVVGRELGKAFRAIAALKKEGAAFGNLAKLALQALRLAGEHKRRHGGKLALDRGQFGLVRIFRDLLNRVVTPTVGLPCHEASFLVRLDDRATPAP